MNDLFQLYYSNEIHRMPQLENFDDDRNIEPDVSLKIKQRGRSDKYQLCVQNGLQPLADKFGLTPDEFAVWFLLIFITVNNVYMLNQV